MKIEAGDRSETRERLKRSINRMIVLRLGVVDVKIEDYV